MQTSLFIAIANMISICCLIAAGLILIKTPERKGKMKLSKQNQEKLGEYKVEYREWLRFFNKNVAGGKIPEATMPDDEVLLCIALIRAVIQQRAENEENRQIEEEARQEREQENKSTGRDSDVDISSFGGSNG